MASPSPASVGGMLVWTRNPVTNPTTVIAAMSSKQAHRIRERLRASTAVRANR
jgi:hypothetical protein